MSGNVVHLATADPILSKAQLARRLKCSTRSIERMAKEGLPSLASLDAMGRRRYRLSEVEAWQSKRAARPRPKDDRIAELEARVARLEQRFGAVAQ